MRASIVQNRIVLLLLVLLIGAIIAGVWVGLRRADLQAGLALAHCRSNLSFVRHALREYREKHGSWPYVPGGKNEEVLRLLSESDWLSPRILREIADPSGDRYPKYEIANRSPEEWQMLSRYGAGKLSWGMIGDWPVVWCRVRADSDVILAVTTHESHESYSTAEFERIGGYMDLIRGAEAPVPKLESIDFSKWGFQERVADIARRGLDNLKRAKRNSLGMVMVPIPGGRFKMGITPETADMLRKREADYVPRERFTDRMPRHEVEVESFWASFEPVSPETWQAYLKSLGRDDEGGPKRNSWNDAMSFCKWLTARERDSGLIKKNEAYRLPTEAEWEWMMMGGAGGPFPYGSDFPREEDAGVYPYSLVNGYGIVAWTYESEFCLDKYDSTFYARSPVANPVCLEVSVPNKWKERVLRGGNWGARWSKSGKPTFLSDRGGITEDSRCDNVGFRAVLARTHITVLAPPTAGALR